MSKYIDVEKLIAEIERRKKQDITFRERNILVDIEICIASLQREQPKPNLEKEIENYTETLYHETFGNGQGTLDEFDFEDIAQVIDDTARYFYNLNKNEA